MSGPCLLVDGKNCIYRAIYANQDNKCHSLVVMLRFIRTWFEKHSPESIHVFWDAPRKTVWRKQILAEYKDRPASRPLGDRDIKDELQKVQLAASEMFNVMNIRQYSRNGQEADDLIYAACRNMQSHDIIIVSSDGDFTQIPFSMPNVRVWEPRLSKFVDRPQSNPVIKKSLMGDLSDCIDGYAGIGNVKSGQMAESPEKLQQFLTTVDRKLFLRNMLLIDLGLCPFLLANQMYVARQMISPIQFCKNTIMNLIGRHRLDGLFQEFQKIVLPFRSLSSNNNEDDVPGQTS